MSLAEWLLTYAENRDSLPSNGGLTAMKFAFGVLVFIWVLCGLIGAWWLGHLNADHWQLVAKGPLTLAKAYNEQPPSYPGP